MQNSQAGPRKLRAVKISAVAIFSVVIVEVLVGLIVNSLAILSDGLHALIDAASMVMLFFAIKASIKPPDEEHTYGHEKFETIGGLIGGIVLIGVAVLIFFEAAMRLFGNSQIASGVEYAGFIAIGYALFISSLRVTVFRKIQHFESPSIKAGFYDAIADFSSTLIALLGFGLATIGFFNGDAFASIFLGAMLSYLSLKLVKSSIIELSDAASKELVQMTRMAILSCEGVVKTEHLKVRKVGSKIFVEASVQVPSTMSLEEAHSLTSKIEACLKEKVGNVDATIHVEPFDRPAKLDDLVKQLASVEGVTEVHDISTNYVSDKLYITLHAYVKPELSVEEAHKISDIIEQRINAAIKPIENVTVQIEPSDIAISNREINDTQFYNVIHKIAKGIASNLRVKRVVTFVAENKRYINIDCCFTKQVKIKEAHRIASLFEQDIKEHFANAVVTVHLEPEGN